MTSSTDLLAPCEIGTHENAVKMRERRYCMPGDFESLHALIDAMTLSARQLAHDSEVVGRRRVRRSVSPSPGADFLA